MKISKFYSLTKKEFKKILDNASTKAEVFDEVGIIRGGNSSKTLEKAAKYFELQDEYEKLLERSFQFNKYFNIGKRKKKSNEEIFCKNSKYLKRGSIKKKLIKDFGFDYECALCGNKGYWNENSLSLQLDHINGVSNDNRIENLRFLCPNCHSQTETFCGKRKKKERKIWLKPRN